MATLAATNRTQHLLAAAIAAAVAALLLPVITICTDRYFVDRNTGSRKGWREWPFCLCSGEWYEQSPIETLMRAENSSEFREDWKLYSETGRSLLGTGTYCSCAPGSPSMAAEPAAMRTHRSLFSDDDLRRYYSTFASGSEEQCDAVAREIALRFDGAVP